ncbi:uncharacterized protein LOC113308960 isoform X2 [Papaver somniferum]|uniref:uncharacterized protein LOC113308960 isoform X2 n=1 Tax=Papaver somniferum TaxID=3469 RepID=UPI000E6F6D85|nr:uncharacterized protein LOC113308960 isoform X2 [Papaver somniferum]
MMVNSAIVWDNEQENETCESNSVYLGIFQLKALLSFATMVQRKEIQRSCASQFHASLYEGLVVPWWSSILSRACSLLRILFLDMRQCYLMEFELPLTYIFQPLQNKQEQSSTQENYGIDRVWKIRHNVAADLSGGRIMMLKKLKFKSLIRLKKRRRRFHLMLLLAQYPVKPNAEQFHSFIITSIMVTSDIWTKTNAISKEVGLLQCSQRQTHLEKLIKSKICRNTASG